MKNDDETLAKLRKMSVDREKPVEHQSLMGKIKSFLKRTDKKEEMLTADQVETIIERRMESYKKSFEEKKKKETIDLTKIWRYVDRVAKEKYGVDGTHMIQKTAWHFLVTTGGMPSGDSVVDKGERAITRIHSITDKIDKISGKSTHFSELETLKKDIDTVVDFKTSLRKLEPPKEISPDEIFSMIGAGMELIENFKAKKQGSEAGNAIVVEQYEHSGEEYKEGETI